MIPSGVEALVTQGRRPRRSQSDGGPGDGRYELFTRCYTLQHCNDVVNHEEFENGKRVLKENLITNKVSLGKWVWSEDNEWPNSYTSLISSNLVQ